MLKWTTSKEVCDSIPLSGYRNEIERKLEAGVKLNSVLSKIADVGASGAIRTNWTEFENVTQDKLAELLKDRGNCKANFVVTLDHEGGKGVLTHHNKIAVFNHEGDVIYSNSTRELGNAVKDACQAMLNSHW